MSAHRSEILDRVSGTEPGQRQLNGIQTTGRSYRNLSQPTYKTLRERDVAIEVRDGITLLADAYRPDTEGRFPALISFSCYPRAIQDIGAPLGFIESGAVDYFAPRGYAQLVVNARGTSGSGGEWTMLDSTERNDLYDVIEWAAAQPWCDGNVGMLGISYFAMAQIAAATVRPPHLKAIFPLAASVGVYEVAWHHGLANSGFFSAWLPAVGALSQKPESFWEGHVVDTVRRVLGTHLLHERIQHLNGEAIVNVLKSVDHAHYPAHPFDDLWQSAMIEHPVRDAFWDDRDSLARLAQVDIPVYLGCDWDNVPVHLPGTFEAWSALAQNPNVRMAMLAPGGIGWPWECLHDEALAWYDHWLKGADTGIMDGAPVRYTLPGTRADGSDGSSDWRESASWPPASTEQTLYLRSDGVLGSEDDGQQRSYLQVTEEIQRPKNANPPTLPDRLEWTTPPADEAFEFAGVIGLTLDASATAHDTGWIAVLYDVAPNGERTPITAGWLRASLAESERTPHPIAPGVMASYAIPVVDNARHIGKGHALSLVVTSSDSAKDAPTILGFRHTSVVESSVNTIASSSRLTLPILPSSAQS